MRGGGFRDGCLEELTFIEKWKENKDDWLSCFVFNFSLGKVSNVQKSRENTMDPHNEWPLSIIVFLWDKWLSLFPKSPKKKLHNDVGIFRNYPTENKVKSFHSALFLFLPLKTPR